MRMTSRGVTNNNALEPEKPVRYRMFGRLVMSKPSTWAAVSPSTSADSRRVRASLTRRQLANEPAQRGLVAERAQTADHCHRRGREGRVTTLRLARTDAGEVHF